jgi:hypothetical protein
MSQDLRGLWQFLSIQFLIPILPRIRIIPLPLHYSKRLTKSPEIPIHFPLDPLSVAPARSVFCVLYMLYVFIFHSLIYLSQLIYWLSPLIGQRGRRLQAAAEERRIQCAHSIEQIEYDPGSNRRTA